MPTITLNPNSDFEVRRTSLTSWNDAVTGNGTSADDTGAITYEQAVYAGNYVCSRIYTLWDTRNIPVNATLISATISYYFTTGRRGTQFGQDMKLFKSDTLSAAANANLFQSLTSTAANTSTDVGGESESAAYYSFQVDGDLLTYFQSQVTNGNKSATLLLSSTDWNNDSVSDPTVINYRTIELDDNTNDPILNVTYSVPLTYSSADDVSIKNGTVILKGGITIIK